MQTSQFGLGTLLLRYSRDFEKQADLLGAQIMARAGYDPRALARMFETIERESRSSGGGGTPQWMSSHPNPGNRTVYINKEAESLQIAKAPDTSQFNPIKAAFAALPPAKSMGELANALPDGDPRIPVLRRLAALQAEKGYQVMGAVGYAGSHYYASWAVTYLITMGDRAAN